MTGFLKLTAPLLLACVLLALPTLSHAQAEFVCQSGNVPPVLLVLSLSGVITPALVVAAYIVRRRRNRERRIFS